MCLYVESIRELGTKMKLTHKKEQFMSKYLKLREYQLDFMKIMNF